MSIARRNGLHAEEAIPLRAAFGAEAGATAGFAWLLEELAAAHLLLDAAPLHQLPEAANRFLDALTLANRQLDHACSEPDRSPARRPSPAGKPRRIADQAQPVYPGFPGPGRDGGFVETAAARHNRPARPETCPQVPPTP